MRAPPADLFLQRMLESGVMVGSLPLMACAVLAVVEPLEMVFAAKVAPRLAWVLSVKAAPAMALAVNSPGALPMVLG